VEERIPPGGPGAYGYLGKWRDDTPFGYIIDGAIRLFDFLRVMW